jgi:hypothetical protein
MDPKRYSKPPHAVREQEGPTGMFKELDATELYCPRCKRSNPVRKYLLLVLPEGDKYEYRCAFCAEPVGTKIDRHQKPLSIIV